MKKPVYFSIPVSLDWNTKVAPILDAFTKYMMNAKIEVRATYWKRGTPYSISMADMSAIVIVTSNNLFKMHVNTLPSGVSAEVKRAKIINIPIYLAYIPSSINAGEVKFYRASLDNSGHFTGIGGTTTDIFNMLTQSKEQSLNNAEYSFFPIDDTKGSSVNKASNRYNPFDSDAAAAYVKDHDNTILYEGVDRRLLLIPR